MPVCSNVRSCVRSSLQVRRDARLVRTVSEVVGEDAALALVANGPRHTHVWWPERQQRRN